MPGSKPGFAPFRCATKHPGMTESLQRDGGSSEGQAMSFSFIGRFGTPPPMHLANKKILHPSVGPPSSYKSCHTVRSQGNQEVRALLGMREAAHWYVYVAQSQDVSATRHSWKRPATYEVDITRLGRGERI